METSLSHAGRAVVGDPDADHRPVLPDIQSSTVDLELLWETNWITSKLTYTWSTYRLLLLRRQVHADCVLLAAWQGGQGSPPWDLFEHNRCSGVYALIEARQLQHQVSPYFLQVLHSAKTGLPYSM